MLKTTKVSKTYSDLDFFTLQTLGGACLELTLYALKVCMKIIQPQRSFIKVSFGGIVQFMRRMIESPLLASGSGKEKIIKTQDHTIGTVEKDRLFPVEMLTKQDFSSPSEAFKKAYQIM